MRKKMLFLLGVSLLCFTVFFNTKDFAEENEPGIFKDKISNETNNENLYSVLKEHH